MGTESIVLYKLIVLYMLDRVNFTLTNSQISDFVLEKGYTNYFTLQEAINGLIESEFVYVSSIRGASHYKITYKGEEALSMFENRIPYAIKQDILDFFEKQQINLKRKLRYSLTTTSTIPMNIPSPASSTTGTSRCWI